MDTQPKARVAMTPPKVHIQSLGCIESAQDAFRLREYFIGNGWIESAGIEDADLVVINTCGVNEKRERDSIKKAARANELKRPDAPLWIVGCLAAINKESFKDLNPERIIPPSMLSEMDDIIKAKRKESEFTSHSLMDQDTRGRLQWFNKVADSINKAKSLGFPFPDSVSRAFNAFEHPDWFYVMTSKGCAHACAYCAIRFAKGVIKSKPIDWIRKEVEEGLEKGYKDIVLSGDDLGSYGYDIGLTVADLLEELVDIPGQFNIRVRNLEPMGLLRVFPRFREIVKTGKIKSITVPLQTGNDDLLKVMKRDYRTEDVLEGLWDLKRICSDLLILTHVLIGFPGETKKHFSQTLQLIRRFPFDGVAPDIYSDRPGVASAKMDGKLSEREKSIRSLRIHGEIIFRVYLKSLGLWGGNTRLFYNR